ncbi:MAG: fluoride efflux transporter CrcB, partial [Leptospiraceae bacterium]|nr:fluoride efflux transporter CrcB [Leptospiraceae bacterium]
MSFIYIAIGGALGSIFRYLVNLFILGKFSPTFPYATLLVNAFGSFLMLFTFTAFSRASVSDPFRLFFAVGFLGAFTTFSAFSFETLQFLKNKEISLAFTNIALN